jgi:hypothetical protein
MSVRADMYQDEARATIGESETVAFLSKPSRLNQPFGERSTFRDTVLRLVITTVLSLPVGRIDLLASGVRADVVFCSSGSKQEEQRLLKLSEAALPSDGNAACPHKNRQGRKRFLQRIGPL